MSDENENQNDNPASLKQVINNEPEEPQTRTDIEKQAAFDTFNKEGKDGKERMEVKVYSPTRVYFDGLAFSLTATNATGEFDILPKHHRFISLLDACDLIIRTSDDDSSKISISGGMLHVKADKVVVFLDI